MHIGQHPKSQGKANNVGVPLCRAGSEWSLHPLQQFQAFLQLLQQNNLSICCGLGAHMGIQVDFLCTASTYQ